MIDESILLRIDEVTGELHESVICDIVDKLLKTDFKVTDTAAWEVEKLQQAGMVYDDIVQAVAERTDKLESEIKTAFDAAEVKAISLPEVYSVGQVSEHIFDSLSPAMAAVWTAACSKTFGEVSNLVGTTASQAQHTFINACELAHQQVVSGSFSYTQAIANAIKAAADKSGYVQYPTGARTTVEAAVRRAVMTSVTQTTAEVSIMRAGELGTDLVEVSAHSGARPEHADWQGGIYSLSGKNPNYPSLVDATGYGSVTGLCGANCGHIFWAYIEGLSTPTYTKTQLEDMKNATVTIDGEAVPLYKARQTVRAGERDVRKYKRQLVGLSRAAEKTGNNVYSAEFNRVSARLKHKESVLKMFCDKTGITYESQRVQVWGFDRSLAQKAVAANKKELAKYTKYLYNKDGTIFVTDDWKSRKHQSIPKEYKPFAIVETKGVKGGVEQIDRTYFDSDGKMLKQVHSGGHGNPTKHPYGKNGEHTHDIIWEQSDIVRRPTREINDTERKENGDIL